jgi:TonB family protein
MKLLRAISLAALLLPAATGLAQFESARLHPDNLMPAYPPSLQMAGITRGFAIVAMSIDTEGKVQDAMVLAHTQPRLAETALEAVRGWRFIPAKLDGTPVPVQTELKIEFSLEGAVISTNLLNHFFFDNLSNTGDMTVVTALCRPERLDQLPQREKGGSPGYATAAAKDGVAGRVQVHFYIDERGEVRFACAEPAGHPYLMEQAVEAVRQWKFAPPTSRGRPVMVAAVQEFNFGGGDR